MQTPRRRILVGCTGFLLGGLSRTREANAVSTHDRFLSFHNLHTGESIRTAYWAGGNYLIDEAKRIAWILRDHRANATHAIDARLLDLLHTLSGQLSVDRPFEVISGYRSPQTNATLAATTEGVASRSLHMFGMAIDIRISGVPLPRLRDMAASLQSGGVGYYPRSDFVHLDVGRVRHW